MILSNMVLRSILSIFILLLINFNLLIAQNTKEFDAKYLSAKQLLNAGKYLQAMEAFKPLMQIHKNNKNAAYSCYFYANAAFQMKDYQAVLVGYNNILTLDPNWVGLEDFYLLLSASYFAKNQYTGGLTYLNKISTSSIRKEAENAESQYIHALLPVDTILSLHVKFPEDQLINKLFKVLEESKKQVELPKLLNVAVILPFSINTIKVDEINRDNQFVLDLYQGMRMGINALKSKGIKIELRAYDVDKDSIKLKSLLAKQEIKNVDLLLGPIYNFQTPIASRLLEKNKIPVVNPLSDNIKAIQNSKNAFLFKASQLTQAIKTAEFAYKAFEKKTVLILYGKESRDTAFARIFRDKYKELGGSVFYFKKIDKFTSVTQLLGKDTLQNAGCVLVCHSDQMVASNLITALAIRNTNTPIISYYDWLDYTAINFEQFEKYNFHFVYPGYVNFDDADVRGFKNEFLQKMNLFPSEYAYWGYEVMLYYGLLLKQFGGEFYTKLNELPEVDGVLTEDHYYGNSRDNQLFPIMKFENSKFIQLK